MRMRDVAERAGVSAATVSRVLNGSTSVRPEYRERVMRTVEEMDYRPNRLASNLRRQKAQVIGVVVSDIENPHFAQMVRVVEDAAYREGFRVMLCNTDESGEKQASYLRMLAGERVLGILLAPSDPGGAEVGDLIDLGIPVVAFDRAVADGRADAVVADNAGGVRLATEHLIRLGHTRIAFIAGRDGIETSSNRYGGYREAMLEAGLEPLYARGGYRISGGRRVVGELLDGGAAGLTGLVVGNNLMTVGALEALRERGVRVPEDVALVGVDDPFWARLLDPPLTTIAQPVREMAARAFRMLLARVGGEREDPRRVVLDFVLRVRGSCGAREGALKTMRRER